MERHILKQRRKIPSFSSSLLDAIYHSIDQPNEQQQQQAQDFVTHKRQNNPSQVEEEIESLRRAIMVEKWMENHTNTTTPRHLPSNSGSSTDSSFFSSSETDSSASKSTPKLSQNPKTSQILQKGPTNRPGMTFQGEKREGRFTRTKSRAMKIYLDLKKAKEPISPGGKIANFLNSIFSPRNMKKNQGLDEWNTSVRKSRSMKDTTSTCILTSRSCLSKNPSNKSKRSVRFGPVSVIVDEDSQPCGHKNLCNDDDEYLVSSSMPSIGSQFLKKNIDSFRYENESDFDDKSCASSDLFELENIGRTGIRAYEEELPVYGTTSLRMNQAIASGLFV